MNKFKKLSIKFGLSLQKKKKKKERELYETNLKQKINNLTELCNFLNKTKKMDEEIYGSLHLDEMLSIGAKKFLELN